MNEEMFTESVINEIHDNLTAMQNKIDQIATERLAIIHAFERRDHAYLIEKGAMTAPTPQSK